MCLPPEHAYKNNSYKGIVKVRPLSGKYLPSASSANGDALPDLSTLDAEYDEDYDVDDDDADEAEAEAPAPAAGGLFPASASSSLAAGPPESRSATQCASHDATATKRTASAASTNE